MFFFILQVVLDNSYLNDSDYAQEQFMAKMLKGHEGQPKVTMKEANKAWMESELRAAVLAARAHKVPM